MNASTFVARVIVSTRSDFVSAVTGAVGALKGPLHGGAPGPALDVVFEIGESSRAEAYLREKLGRGERLMGFGHRIYRTRDPRADVLAAAAERLYTTDGDRELYASRAGRREDGASAAGGAQAGEESADQRRVLHGATVARAGFADGALHAHLRGREGGWVDGPLLRAEGSRPPNQAAVGVRGGAGQELGAAGGAVGEDEKRPPEIRGPYPSECYAGIPLFSTSAFTTWEADKVTQDPAGCFGGPRSEPPLPEDTRDYYSMRLSGSPPLACRQLREVYYHLGHRARAVVKIGFLRGEA